MTIRCGRCGKKRIIKAKGMCISCYTTSRRIAKDTPDKRRQRAEKEQQRRKRLGDIYRESERARNRRRKEQKKKYHREYFQKNKARMSAYYRDFRKRFPEKVRAWDQNRRARKLLAGKISPQEWEEILKKYNHSCYYCKRNNVKLEMEHKVPISRGGKNAKENVVPSCRSCNAAKYTKTDEEFLATLI